ncbi:MAG: hypothetical protein KIT22_17005 [Verrucomicrobiae bacterium]|nr:hypothetical protein [Verrucomicrobiae bacterium]
MPQSLYMDRDSIYRCEREGNVEEPVAGEEPLTQFGRAMKQLGVELILANSPQAKGRVEGRNGVLQDRLVKALRLEGISDLESANRYLQRRFLPGFNRRFEVAAAGKADVHRQCEVDLNRVLSWETERVVAKDWTVAWEGQWYQLEAQSAGHPVRSGVRVLVRRRRDGRLEMEQRGRRLRFRRLPARPTRPTPPPRRVGRVRLSPPEATHPWRRFGAAVGQPWKLRAQREGRTR